jgi:hypothetical protein
VAFEITTSGVLTLVMGILLAVGLSLAIRYFLHDRRFELHESGKHYVYKPDRKERHEDVSASFSSEKIEEMVKARLAEYPDLLQTHFDFRTSSDGMLEIVFGERTYQDVDQIPDDRVRQAIAEAVEEFNRKGT